MATEPNTVIIVGGLAGSGKSTIARILATRLRFCLLDLDTVTAPLTEAFLRALPNSAGTNDRHSAAYRSRLRDPQYRCLYDLMEENIALGVSMIAVAPFNTEARNQAWQPSLREKFPHTNIFLIWVTVSPQTNRERISGRASGRDLWKIENWDTYVANINNHFIPEQTDYIVNNDDKEVHLKKAAGDIIAMINRNSKPAST